ncbi:helix-turn-helix transcriptional regulator [Vibrio sp. S17_S38]|uniref:helix-turn-helix transcriptional regulator n=1 Tax=Vibrio sp. S17_S38 TaxID=2720229 RepID=UPI0016803C0D|nr:helix-turn-helix transcriptional regulator [Vibrio sp. S17_S38]MBD1572635.1 helix-turn-helix transcriptional regulator [Vibrio sp. S17_S38]
MNHQLHVKNETTYNIPIVIDKNVTSSGITLLALWNTFADKHYQVEWPKDRLRPLIEGSVIALYTKQGHGEIELSSGETLQLEGSTVIFLHPTSIKKYRCKGLIWELFLMEFIPNGAINLVYNHLISLTNNEYFHKEMNQVVELFKQQESTYKHLAAASLTKTIYHWLTLTKVREQDHKLNTVQEVITQIHLNMTKKWTVKEMAQLAECTEQHLRKMFLQYTNQTPKEYYLNTRLIASKSLIKHKKYTVQEAAAKLNFYDAFHFSKAFKNKFGFPPSELYRLHSI